MLPVKIAGLGSYLPERVVTSAELERELGLAPGWVARTAGVLERRRATHETAAGMAAAAGRRALQAAGMAPADLDLIIAAASAPQQAIPCTAALVQRELDAPDGASACFDVNATCLSFLAALQTAAHLVAAGAYRAALVVSSEIAGPSLNPREPESAVLFGDGAAAAVIVPTPAGEPSALVGAQFATFSSGADLTTIRGGGTLRHPNDPATTPEDNMFHMSGTAVYKKAARLVGPFLQNLLGRVGWEQGAIDTVVPHQASGHAVALLTGRYGFRPEQVASNLAERGNCIAASIPLALAEAVAAGRIARGQRILLLGTGAGLSIGAAGLVY
jgi:3-oxoacyl-[acyl-carrier-protein] synthase-3